MKPCDENLLKTLHLAGRMMRLADKGDSQREDTGCGILYGVMRDAAYKLQQLAQAEQKAHLARRGRPPAP